MLDAGAELIAPGDRPEECDQIEVAALHAAKTGDWTHLDALLMDAYEEENWTRLVDIYIRAARLSDGAVNPGGAAFFLTQAYVFALQIDDPRAEALHADLRSRGCEE